MTNDERIRSMGRASLTHPMLAKENIKAAVLSRLRVIAFATLIVLRGHEALAQPISALQQTVPNPNSYCSGSTLTGAAFLQLIQTIMAHGDLTDIAFQERTLGTKFSSRFGSSEVGKTDPKIVILESQRILGNPLSVKITIYYSKSDQLKFGEIAGLGFDNSSTFIPVCFHFSPAEISSYFKEGFYREILYGSPVATYYQEHSSPGKNGSKINVGFQYDIKDSVVSYIGIGQYP